MVVRKARKITPNLEREIMAKAADGESPQAIAAWLEKERGVKISRQAVFNRLKQTRVERAEVAKVVTREKLSKSVGSDLEGLTREQGRVESLALLAYDEAVCAFQTMAKHRSGEHVDKAELKVAVMMVATAAELALKTTDRAIKLATVKLHLSGADVDDSKLDVTKMTDEELDAHIRGLKD
jgi:hypothetical protein